MKKTMLVMLYEMHTTLRRKTFLLVAVGLPLLLGVVALVVASVNRDAATRPLQTAPAGASQRALQGYVDVGGLIETLPPDIPFGWLTEYPDEAAAQVALEAGKVVAYTIIPADYVATGILTVVQLEYNPVTEKIDIDPVTWALQYNLLHDAELAANVWTPLDVEWTPLAGIETQTHQDSWIVELLPGLMVLTLYAAILLPAGILMNAVTDEKRNRVLEMLMSSISPQQISPARFRRWACWRCCRQRCGSACCGRWRDLAGSL